MINAILKYPLFYRTYQKIVRKKFDEYISDPSELDRLLDIGAENASLISEPKVIEMKRKMGFI